MSEIIFNRHCGVTVLRDDLIGGTKSIILPHLLDPTKDEYVYASPVQGGFQIALADYCHKNNKKATIFCADRKVMHPNTRKCVELGASIVPVKPGYLSCVEKQARDYSHQNNVQKIQFGAKSDLTIKLLSDRVRDVIHHVWYDNEPDEIWCAVGSGMLVEAILEGTGIAKIHGVCVGADYQNDHERLSLYQYHKPFDKPSTVMQHFPSMPHYDLKAWEYCMQRKCSGDVMFWNVM